MKIVTNIVFSTILISFGLFAARIIVWPHYSDHHHQHFEDLETTEQRDELLSHKDFLRRNLLSQGQYQCCLEKPCTYCLEKTPKHGEGASCTCLSDIMNGVHPCGECIGEILEGHGNKFLSKYFAKSIAEEVGVEYTDTIKEIIASKYNITVEEQL
jgi:hypothetical protein